MPSSIAWLDFSESDRRKMIEVVRLFGQPDTRDEMGLAPIRDALAEILFPGTGTLQTRARYFLFIPWTYTYYEHRGVSSARVVDRLRYDEIRLIRALKQANENGVIGQVSGANLLRFPSSIYWYGLRQWGILHYPGTQAQYHRSLDSYYIRQKAFKTQEVEEYDQGFQTNWDPHLPLRPESFPWEVSSQESTFNLKYDEADYLRERLQASCPDSLLAYLVVNSRPVETIPFVWLHPEAAGFPDRLQTLLLHARNFSEAFWGAALLYNLMLSQKADMPEQVDKYETQLQQWREMLRERNTVFRRWDRRAFWSHLSAYRVPSRTQAFVEEWLDLLFNGPDIPNLIDDARARDFVRRREYQLKRNRSRFENPRRLEIWGGASSAGQLNFRWANASRLLNDILYSLEPGTIEDRGDDAGD